MTATSALSLRTVTFGTLDGAVWGAAWFGENPIVVLGGSRIGEGHILAGGTLAGAESTEHWTLVADGSEFAIAGAGDPVHGVFDGGADGFDQLCRVQGSATLAGAAVEVDCLGRRATRSSLDLSRYASIRDVSAWFEPDEGLALTALRPRKAKSQAKDVIVAAVLDAAGGQPVVDPRLSTTYDALGTPRRVGLELWLDEPEGGEQYPRRVAAEAVRSGVVAGDGATELRAELLRCHSRGLEGAGVYLLATR